MSRQPAYLPLSGEFADVGEEGEEVGWVFTQAADGPGLPIAVLPQQHGELDYDPERSLQVESRVVGFAKDRA